MGSYTLGVDLGGTKIAMALVDAEGTIVASHVIPTHVETGPAGVIADIATCVSERLAVGGTARASALGIGVAGQVDGKTGAVHFAPNLRWHEVPLREDLERTLGLPVVVTNDVRAVTWGEWMHGAGRGARDLVTVFVGTGIGGGVVTGGQMLVGCTNTAGELGHMTIVTGGRKCTCPNRGCLEAYAGGWAIAEQAREAVQRDPAAGRRLVSIAGGIDEITTRAVAQAYQEGDLLARRLVHDVGQHLGAGIVGIVNAFNPCLVIIGGGVIQGLPDLVTMAEDVVRTHALGTAVGGLRIARAVLGTDAGVIGAAAMARQGRS